MRSFNVDDKLKDREVIKNAIIEICEKKKKKKTGSNNKYKRAQNILRRLDENTDIILELILATEVVMLREEKGIFIHDDIWDKSFKPRKYKTFTIIDGPSKKERDITSVPLFPDQIIHQLIISIGEPGFMNGMYEYSCGSIPKKGPHKGVKYMKKVIKHHNKHDKSAIKYGAQLDVAKCYDSISHTHLKEKLREKFKGKLYIWVSFLIIDNYHHSKINGEYYGVAIGFSPSQWWCNFVLTPLDHYIKQELGVEYYIRYIDDMVFFGRNKKKLHDVVRNIIEFAKSMGLTIKENYQVFRFDYIDREGKRRGRDFDFLGFRFFRDKTIFRKRNALTIKRRVNRVSRMGNITAHAAQSLMSRLGSLKHCDSYNFYHKNVKPFIDIRKLKKVISDESKMMHLIKPQSQT